jgi:hypothetical protein
MRQYGAAILRGVTLRREGPPSAFSSRDSWPIAGASSPGGFSPIYESEGRNILLLHTCFRQSMVAREREAESNPPDVTLIQYPQLLPPHGARDNCGSEVRRGSHILDRDMQNTGTKYAKYCQLATGSGKSGFRYEVHFSSECAVVLAVFAVSTLACAMAILVQ